MEPVWGKIDAAHVFCEPKYATSSYFAEFYNSLSSIVYVVAGGVGLVLSRQWKSDWRIQVAWVMLFVVGIGSIMFHATMRFSMELCDEIPMLFLILAFLSGKEDCIWFMSGPVGRQRFRLVAISLIVLSIVSYVAFGIYEIFVYSFGLAVLFEIGIDLACRPKTWQTRVSFIIAVTCIGLGYVAWNLEQHLCTKQPDFWPLHIIWHVLSCFGAVFAIVHNVFLRREKIEI